MTDTKLSALPAMGVVADTDLMYMADVSLGTAGSSKITVASLRAALNTAAGFVLKTGDTMSGTITVLAAGGLVTRAAATQDSVTVAGTAIGTSSRGVTITGPVSALADSRTFRLPDADVIAAGSAVALTSGRVPYVTTGGLLLDHADLSANPAAAGDVLTLGSNARASSTYLNINAAAGQLRGVIISTGGSRRWLMYGDNTPETGADAGTPWRISAYTDAAGFIDSPISITRAAGGAITLARPISASIARSPAGTDSPIIMAVTYTPPADLTANLQTLTAQAIYAGVANLAGRVTSIRAILTLGGSGARGGECIQITPTASGSGTVPAMNGITLEAPTISGAVVTVYQGITHATITGLATTVKAINLNGISSAGTLNVGVDIGAITGATANYALRTNTGLVNFGDVVGIGVVPTVGAGLLQLASGTTIANGILLGDVGIFRSAANTLSINATSGATATGTVTGNGTLAFRAFSASGVANYISFFQNTQWEWSIGQRIGKTFVLNTGGALGGTDVLSLNNLTGNAAFSGSGIFGAAAAIGSEIARFAGGTIAAPTATDVIVGGGALRIGAATAATTTATGALTVGGGGGFGGALWAQSLNTSTGTLTVASGTDQLATLGNIKLGSTLNAGDMHMAVFGQYALTTYALAQLAAGSTKVNAPTGQTVSLRVNDVALLTAAGSALTATVPLTLAGGLGLKSDSYAGNQTLLTTNSIAIYTGAGGHTFTLPLAAAMGAANTPFLVIRHNGTGTLTISRADGSDTVNGATTVSLTAGQSYILVSNGVASWMDI